LDFLWVVSTFGGGGGWSGEIGLENVIQVARQVDKFVN